ncbi:hypothetical protein RUM43_000460 [Polyplax serrata]|uniref:Uncharacterized protein n=1 Tax=Polyplax serrata TaxID=468196 RepID=A0AAN8SCH7_POLSC
MTASERVEDDEEWQFSHKTIRFLAFLNKPNERKVIWKKPTASSDEMKFSHTAGPGTLRIGSYARNVKRVDGSGRRLAPRKICCYKTIDSLRPQSCDVFELSISKNSIYLFMEVIEINRTTTWCNLTHESVLIIAEAFTKQR